MLFSVFRVVTDLSVWIDLASELSLLAFSAPIFLSTILEYDFWFTVNVRFFEFFCGFSEVFAALMKRQNF